jgi:hypothetical protein
MRAGASQRAAKASMRRQLRRRRDSGRSNACRIAQDGRGRFEERQFRVCSVVRRNDIHAERKHRPTPPGVIAPRSALHFLP